MLKCTFDLIGTAPISFSKPVSSTKITGEKHDSFEKRTWRERLHVDRDGNAFIPPMALKNCLSECAQYLSETVPGKGKATYTKHVVGGVMVTDPMIVCDDKWKPIPGDDVVGERLFVPADGKRGGGKRVWKTFPVIPAWRVHATAYVLDPVLTSPPDEGEMHKIEEYARHAGKFIGMLRFRPRNNGFYGRWEVENFKIAEE